MGRPPLQLYVLKRASLALPGMLASTAALNGATQGCAGVFSAKYS